nr:hypothetical protein CFP56_76729 [Quercus suber]
MTIRKEISRNSRNKFLISTFRSGLGRDIIPHHRPHGDRHPPFKEGDNGNYHLALLFVYAPIPVLTISQTYIAGNSVVGDEFLHRLLSIDVFLKPTHPG